MSASPDVERDPTVKMPPLQAAKPKWDPQRAYAVTRTRVRWLTMSIAALWVATVIWLLFVAPIYKMPAAPLAVGADLFSALAPVLFLGLCIELALEFLFGFIENHWRTLVAYWGYGLQWLYNATTELNEARRLLDEVSTAARNIQIDYPTATWLREMKEQRQPSDQATTQGAASSREPLLKLSDDSLSELRRSITALFSEDELRTLYFDLGVDYDNLGGETKESKVRELIQYHYRRGQLRQLIKKCAELRDDIQWKGLDEKSTERQAEITSFEEYFARALDKAQEQSELISAMYAIAKKRVAEAERELESGVSAPSYRRSKSATCVTLGLWLGVVVCGLAQIQLLALFGTGIAGARLDILFSGVVAGAFARLIHVLLQAFQNLMSRLSP